METLSRDRPEKRKRLMCTTSTGGRRKMERRLTQRLLALHRSQS